MARKHGEKNLEEHMPGKEKQRYSRVPNNGGGGDIRYPYL